MLVAPPRWNAVTESLSQVSRGPSLLMLDYDGTLAPFHQDRMQALPWPGIAERLDRLATIPTVHLALVTGRSARELASLLPLRRAVEIWGSHGREHLTPDGVYTSATLAPAQQAALDQMEKALKEAGFGAQAERKVASLAATAGEVRDLARRQFHPSAPSSSATTTRSSNGSVCVPMV